MTFNRKTPHRRAMLALLLLAVAFLVSACSDFNIRSAMPPDPATTQGVGDPATCTTSSS